MGHVANSENVQEELQFQQQTSDELEFLIIPTTPNNTPEVIMTDASDTHPPHDNGATEQESTHPEQVDKNYKDEDDNAKVGTGADEDEDPYASLDPNTILAIPITNPSAFPIQRLQHVQAQYYPSTHIVNMLVHKTPSGPITQVTADVQDGQVNHLLIHDARLISALGLAAPHFDAINLDNTKLRLDETFTIRILPGQQAKTLDDWLMGELESAKHAYLLWLDHRWSADPSSPPFAAEAKMIATNTQRRWPDVMREIEAVWKLEHGPYGREYRENRLKYLGENRTYENADGPRVRTSMFR